MYTRFRTVIGLNLLRNAGIFFGVFFCLSCQLVINHRHKYNLTRNLLEKSKLDQYEHEKGRTIFWLARKKYKESAHISLVHDAVKFTQVYRWNILPPSSGRKSN